jgi:hypothetical protein
MAITARSHQKTILAAVYWWFNTHKVKMQMRTCIAIIVVVTIGLIWSVAAMSELVPVQSWEMRSAKISHVATMRRVRGP